MQVQSLDVIRAIRDAAKITIGEGTPTDLLMQIRPVIDATPDFHRLTNAIVHNSSTTSGTMNTTVPDKPEVYIDSIYFSFSKNATCDIATGTIKITFTIDSSAITVFRVPVLTLTAERDQVYIKFRKPIKVDPATNIAVDGSFTAGSLVRSMTAFGYTKQ